MTPQQAICLSVGPGYEIPYDPYEDLCADLGILKWKPAELCKRLGISPQTFYRWKKLGVPQYASAYASLAIERYFGRGGE